MQLPRYWSKPIAVGCLLFSVATTASVRADEKPQFKRELLFPAKADDVPASLKPFVAKLMSTEQKPVEASTVIRGEVFARLVTKKHILDSGALKKSGTLGSKPFVCTTLPEALYGRSLLEVFSTIGYAADDVLTGQLEEEKVVVLFRWDKNVVVHSAQDGALPDSWQTAVYPATWDNIFSLVDKMAGDREWSYVREVNEPAVFTKLQLRSEKERHFLVGFPDAGKLRIKSASYYALRDSKGADWEYRQFLEHSMSLAEHFSGDGATKPTIVGQAKPPAGFPEFIGPNRLVVELPEVAVIGLGALRVVEK
jgi:hypothetical protein